MHEPARQPFPGKIRLGPSRLVSQVRASYLGRAFVSFNAGTYHREPHIQSRPKRVIRSGFIESFNGPLRAECLDREQLWTLSEARVVIEDWRQRYNQVRPYRGLGYETPKDFAMVAVQAAAFGRALSPSHRA